MTDVAEKTFGQSSNREGDRSPDEILVRSDGSLVPLTRREAGLLGFLRRQGRAVDKATLLHEVFGYHPDTETHTLETHVWRIRRKIEPDPKAPRMLVSEPGGYRLVAD